jgi:hypothetical protein
MKMINIEITQPEIEIEAHNLDCKIVSIKAEIAEEYYDDDKLELLIEYAMKLGEAYAQRDFNKKLEGCVVVPVELSDDVADGLVSKLFEGFKDTFNSEHRDLSATEREQLRLRWSRAKARTLQQDYKLFVEAARGGK